MNFQKIVTPDGAFTAFFSDRGLARLDFPGSRPGPALAPAAAPEPAAARNLTTPQRAWLHLTQKALDRALAGSAPDAIPPLDLSTGTEFQQAVWQALRSIPPGATRSYGEVAEAVGRPAAVRAVGQACGANPIPVLVPCHRVLAAQGRLGGFSGGLRWKRLLLEREHAGYNGDTPLLAGLAREHR